MVVVQRNEYRSKPNKLKLDMKHHESPYATTSIVDAPELEITALELHLRFVFLGIHNTLPVTITTEINGEQVECLVAVLKRFKRAIGWTIADIIGIPPGIFSHKSNS